MIEYDGLPAFCRDFLSYMETIQNRSLETVNGYYYDLRIFFKYIKKIKYGCNDESDNIRIDDITVKDLENMNISDFNAYMTFLTR